MLSVIILHKNILLKKLELQQNSYIKKYSYLDNQNIF